MYHFFNKKIDPYQTITDVFTDDDLDRIINFCKNSNLSDGNVGQGSDESNNSVYRKSKIFWMTPYQDDILWVFEKLAEVCQMVNHFNFNTNIFALEDIQYTEYDEKYSGFYGKHIDSFKDLTRADERKLSITVQLSDGDTYKGGDLILYPGNKPVTVSRERGTVTIFTSDVVHEVLPVTSGNRKSLVTWCIGSR